MSKITEPFIGLVASCWVNGKAVHIYGSGDVRQLRAETTGGKHVPQTRIETMSTSEYENLREQWAAGCTSRDDARIQQRALRHLGLDM